MNDLSAVQERFKNIIKECLDLPLKGYGFKKKGNKYVKEDNSFFYEISIQKVFYNDKNHISFTINWSIWWQKDLMKTLPFPFLAPLIEGRISKLYESEKPGAWFRIDAADKNPDKKDKEDIEYLKNLLPVAMKKILDIKKIEDIINILEKIPKPQNYLMAPISGVQTEKWRAYLNYMIGEKEKAIKIFETLVKNSDTPSFKKGFEETRDQMISGL